MRRKLDHLGLTREQRKRLSAHRARIVALLTEILEVCSAAVGEFMPPQLDQQHASLHQAVLDGYQAQPTIVLWQRLTHYITILLHEDDLPTHTVMEQAVAFFHWVMSGVSEHPTDVTLYVLEQQHRELCTNTLN